MASFRILLILAAVAAFTLPLDAADKPDAFKAKCAMCHGQDGIGATPMGKKLNIRSFAAVEVQKQTDAQLLAVINKGKGKMPAYEGKIPEPELKALVARIRSFAKK